VRVWRVAKFPMMLVLASAYIPQLQREGASGWDWTLVAGAASYRWLVARRRRWGEE